MDTIRVFRHKDGGKVFLENELVCLDGFEIEEEFELLEEAQIFVEEFNVPVIWVYLDVITPHYFLYAGYRGDMWKRRVFGMIKLQKELVFESLEDAQEERDQGIKEMSNAGASVS